MTKVINFLSGLKNKVMKYSQLFLGGKNEEENWEFVIHEIEW